MPWSAKASAISRKRWRFSGERARSLRSEEHTSELQSRPHLVCRLLLEKKKRKYVFTTYFNAKKMGRVPHELINTIKAIIRATDDAVTVVIIVYCSNNLDVRMQLNSGA